MNLYSSIIKSELQLAKGIKIAGDKCYGNKQNRVKGVFRDVFGYKYQKAPIVALTDLVLSSAARSLGVGRTR